MTQVIVTADYTFDDIRTVQKSEFSTKIPYDKVFKRVCELVDPQRYAVTGNLAEMTVTVTYFHVGWSHILINRLKNKLEKP